MNCKECGYWVKAKDGSLNWGKCHRFPPIGHEIANCAETYWCGEFKPTVVIETEIKEV